MSKPLFAYKTHILEITRKQVILCTINCVSVWKSGDQKKEKKESVDRNITQYNITSSFLCRRRTKKTPHFSCAVIFEYAYPRVFCGIVRVVHTYARNNLSFPICSSPFDAHTHAHTRTCHTYSSKTQPKSATGMECALERRNSRERKSTVSVSERLLFYSSVVFGFLFE